MSISVLINALASKVSKLEQSVAQAAAQAKQWTDNHHGLIGMLQATKEALQDAQKVVDMVAPDSSAADALNTAENLVNVVDTVANNVAAETELQVDN